MTFASDHLQQTPVHDDKVANDEYRKGVVKAPVVVNFWNRIDLPQCDGLRVQVATRRLEEREAWGSHPLKQTMATHCQSNNCPSGVIPSGHATMGKP